MTISLTNFRQFFSSTQGVAILAALWLAVPLNLALWQKLQGLGLGFAFMAAFALAITGLLCALLSFFSHHRLLPWAIAALCLMAAVTQHFMRAYGVVIDTTMIANALQTDAKETAGLLNLPMLWQVLWGFVLPAIVLWRVKIQAASSRRSALIRGVLLATAGIALTVIALLSQFSTFASTMRNHKEIRYLINPLNTLYAVGYLAYEPFKTQRKFEMIGHDVRVVRDPQNTSEKPPLLVLVIGETARSANFSLNGYARETNPALKALQSQGGVSGQLWSYQNATSCGTNTAMSVPCIFSHLPRTEFFDRKAEYANVLDIAQLAGLAVHWRDNQAGCKGVCDRVPNDNTSAAFKNEQGKLFDADTCSSSECFDARMLKDLDRVLDAIPAEKRQRGTILVLHSMGSHGPAYYQRVPESAKVFKPECASNVLQSCTPEQLRNSYDNTIFYADRFLAQTVKWLQAKSAHHATAMLYVSDHGESLGEKGVYLHGLPYAIAPKEQTSVPLITWLSPDFIYKHKLNLACLNESSKTNIVSHDNIFHSVLGALGLSTDLYKPELDIYRACQN